MPTGSSLGSLNGALKEVYELYLSRFEASMWGVPKYAVYIGAGKYGFMGYGKARRRVRWGVVLRVADGKKRKRLNEATIKALQVQQRLGILPKAPEGWIYMDTDPRDLEKHTAFDASPEKKETTDG